MAPVELFLVIGQHWLRVSALYAPAAEGGQGLVDIMSRTAAFRLQMAQRPLLGCGHCCLAPAPLLLRKAGQLGLDKQIFLLRSFEADLIGLKPFFFFYSLADEAWQMLKVTWIPDPRLGMWLFEELLFYNDFLTNTTLT